MIESQAFRSRPCGHALQLLLHILLVLVIAGEILYLASMHRVRFDVTGDQLYTLTDATEKVLSRLDKRLLIEAYFSPDESLASSQREARRTLTNMLDEFVQSSDERLVVNYLDPQSDDDLREKATRLGIKAQRVQDVEQTTFSNKEIWQGLRFRYGSRQKIVPQIGFSESSAAYEASLTPVIKALTVAEKPRVGVLAWAGLPPLSGNSGPSREGARGFDYLLTLEVITDRYQFVNLDLSEGQHVPTDIDRLLMFRPKNLNDRSKYVIDQFLMRGGTLVVFADNDDVSLGQARRLTVREVRYDVAGSKIKFRDQLAAYGVEVSDRMLIDLEPRARDDFAVVMQTMQGPALQPLPYFYWFHPLPVDWAERANDVARREDGTVDEELAATYADVFLPGIDEERTKGLGAANFYWPVAVELSETLPAGVEGHVLFRTSPFACEVPPPPDVHPFGFEPSQAESTYKQFVGELQQRYLAGQPKQFGLMVDLTGSFPSAFRGKKIPSARPEPEPPAKEVDPLEPEQPKDEELVGPTLPGPEGEPEQPAVDDEPEPILQAERPGRLVVVGDADFLRDDLVTGAYAQLGGPVSRQGLLFFANLLDWLAEDEDLFALRGKTFTDRSQRYIDESVIASSMTPQRAAQAVRDRERWARSLNVVVPPLLLAGFGLLVMWRRGARKKAFLASLNG